MAVDERAVGAAVGGENEGSLNRQGWGFGPLTCLEKFGVSVGEKSQLREQSARRECQGKGDGHGGDMPIDPFDSLTLRQTDDPDLLAATADRVGRHCHAPVFVTIAPAVAPPAKWSVSKQKGPVALAAWAARYCDDGEALRAIYATPNLRRTVLEGLCASSHLPDDLRAKIGDDYADDRNVIHRLALSLSVAEVVTTVAAGIRLYGAAEGSADENSGEWSGPREFGGVTQRQINYLLGERSLDDEQVAVLVDAYLSQDDWQHALELVESWRSHTTSEPVILEAILAHYDWGFSPSSPLANDPDLAAALELAPLVDADHQAGGQLANAMLRHADTLSDIQFAQVVSVALCFGLTDNVLSIVDTRDRLSLALDLLPANVAIGHLGRNLANLFAPGATEGTGTESDPLMDRLFGRCATEAFPSVLAGRWAPYLPGVFGDPILANPKQAASMVRRCELRGTSDLVTETYRAIGDGTLSGPYQELLLDKVRGLAHRVVTWADDRRPGTPFDAADEWIWVRLSVATSRADLAIDQLRTSSSRSLDEVCAVLSGLDRVSSHVRRNL